MYKLAYACNHEKIAYYDLAGNKYIASGGNLAWRINNSGLVHSHSHFSVSNGSIGSVGVYSIFSTPQQGRQALIRWLQSKKYYDSSLRILAEHYQPDAPEIFLEKLSSIAIMSSDVKLKNLDNMEFDRLVIAIERLCEYIKTGNENFSLLPRITARIENGKNQEDTYLVGDRVILSKQEAIEWILSHRLDAVIVHQRNMRVYIRSRPKHRIWHIKMLEENLPLTEGKIDPLIRIVGERKAGQCIWGFINGIRYSKDDALEAASNISMMAGSEAVFSMPNDTSIFGLKDGAACIALKLTVDTPIVQWAVKFFRYLLDLSNQDSKHPPVIVFIHSQGAIISEHALELLTEGERKRLRIFSFGGGSFIEHGKCHSDSHNYASAAEFVCPIGSPNLFYYSLERYYGGKKGLSEGQVIRRLAYQDALLTLDSTDPKIIEAYMQDRMKFYEKEFARIGNVTILDPDPDSRWKHEFSSSCYQSTVSGIIKKYQSER